MYIYYIFMDKYWKDRSNRQNVHKNLLHQLNDSSLGRSICEITLPFSYPMSWRFLSRRRFSIYSLLFHTN